MLRKELGSIKHVRFGLGGYQDACIGIHFSLCGDGWGVNDSKSSWDKNQIPWTEHCKWSEEDRSRSYDETVRYISDLLHLSKVDDVSKLKGIPIEASFDGNILKEWRILTEVL